MECPYTGAQLLASNLQYLLQYLSGEAPQMPVLNRPENVNREQSAGGALFLSAVAQKRANGL